MKEQESVQTKIAAEIKFLRTFKEGPRFCCQGCGDQRYRIIMRGAIPVGGGPPVSWEKMRICDTCFEQGLTAAEESGIL